MRKISLFVAVVLVAACNRVELDFTMDSFNEGALIRESLPYDFQDLLGNPSGLVWLGNDKIAVMEPMKTKQIAILDVDNGAVVNVAQSGGGPEEILTAWQVIPKNGKWFVYDPVGEQSLFFAYDGGELIMPPYKESVGGMYLRVCGIDNGYVAFSLPDLESSRLTFYDNDWTKVGVASFHSDFFRDGLNPTNDMFQSLIGYSKAKDRIVTACLGAPYIDIYQGDGTLFKHLRGPREDRNEFREVKLPNGGVMQICDSMEPFYGGLSVSDDRFMVGLLNADNAISVFLVFDMKGSPIVRLIPDLPILAFDVDWVDETIYSLVYENEPRLVKYHFSS